MKILIFALLLSLDAIAGDTQVFFSPHGGCTEAVTAALAKARATVLVQDEPKDWWILGDGKTGQKWNLLPVYHPAARLPNADAEYRRSAIIFRELP